MAIEYFPCYHSYRNKLKNLSDQELGRLFRALFEYSETGERQQLAGRESIAYDFITDDIDRSRESYENRCNINRENAKKRYDCKQSQADASETCQTKTKGKDKSKGKIKDNTPQSPQGAEDAFAQFAGDNADLLRALRDFEAMRKKIRSPVTDRAKELLCMKLSKMTPDTGKQIAILEQSTVNSWKGVFPLNEQKTQEQQRQKSFTEIAREMMERQEEGGGIFDF